MRCNAHLYPGWRVQTLCDVKCSLLRKLTHIHARTHMYTHNTHTRLYARRDSWHLSHQVDCGDDLMINEIRYEIDIHRGQEASTIVPTAIGDANQKELVAWACVSVRRSKSKHVIWYMIPHTHIHTNIYIYIFICLNIPFMLSTYMPICMCTYTYIPIYVHYYMIYVHDPSRASARFYDGCLQWISSVQIGWMLSLLHASSHTRRI